MYLMYMLKIKKTGKFFHIQLASSKCVLVHFSRKLTFNKTTTKATTKKNDCGMIYWYALFRFWYVRCSYFGKHKRFVHKTTTMTREEKTERFG